MKQYTAKAIAADDKPIAHTTEPRESMSDAINDARSIIVTRGCKIRVYGHWGLAAIANMDGQIERIYA